MNLGQYRDHTLNDLPEFEGLNPSIEHFSRILCNRLVDGLETNALSGVTVRVHEDDVAWASFAIDLSENGNGSK